MERICIFCGAQPGHDPVYAEAAAALESLASVMEAEILRFDDLSGDPLEPWIEELRAGNAMDQTLPSF